MNKKSLTVLLILCVMTFLIMASGPYPGYGAEKKVKLNIKLPKPLFAGTPQNIRTPNLEPLRKGPRPALLVPAGTKNISLNQPVTASDMEPIIGEIKLIDDGDKEAVEGSYVEFGPGKQYVQIDLKASAAIYAVVLWHYHSTARVYHDIVIQVSDDPAFAMNVNTIFNNDHDNSSGLGIGKDREYIETFEGKLIDAKGVKGRYVRLYSNGNTSDDMNHYIEVEIYGLPGSPAK